MVSARAGSLRIPSSQIGQGLGGLATARTVGRSGDRRPAIRPAENEWRRLRTAKTPTEPHGSVGVFAAERRNKPADNRNGIDLTSLETTPNQTSPPRRGAGRLAFIPEQVQSITQPNGKARRIADDFNPRISPSGGRSHFATANTKSHPDGSKATSMADLPTPDPYTRRAALIHDTDRRSHLRMMA